LRKGKSLWNFIGFGSGFYDAEYLFTVDEHVFIPPPKVKSVVSCAEKGLQLPCGEKIILYCRKTFSATTQNLRNSLKTLNLSDALREDEINLDRNN
jgi:16S rRNA (adenine1518-N6/adenine1519-N6)-dimethyltransferase